MEKGRTDVNKLGEFGLIDHLTKKFSLKNKSSKKGIGDDSAIIDNSGFLTVISTDMLVEGIHFDLTYTPLKHLGYKSVVVNLSDIYAMNAIPKQITVSFAISNRFSVEALDEFYAGVYAACNFYNVDLVGGDTTSSPKGMNISITAIGQGTKEKLSYRNNAKVGDILCVTGDLGAAYIGLQLLEREKQVYLADPSMKPELDDHRFLIERFLKPEARKDIIESFARAELVPTSMMDISDGLASELHHICTQSNVGCFVEELNIPIENETKIQALEFNIDPTVCALNGGEDYELLFTVDPKDAEKIKFMNDIYLIGEIVDKKDGITLHTESGQIHNITAQGWQHF